MAEQNPTNSLSNNITAFFKNTTNVKKLLFFVIIILFLGLLINMFSAFTSKYNNVTNHSNKKIEKLSNDDESNEEESNEDQPNNVHTINLDPKKVNVTLFFAEWCGHCKEFKKKSWGKLNKKYKTSSIAVLHELDCSEIKTAISTPGGKPIEGFPTLIINYINENGEPVEEEYRGSRSYDAIVEHITNLSAKLQK